MKKEISLVFKYILELDLSKWEFSSLLFATIMANLINLTQPFFLGKVIDGVTTFSNLAIVNNLLFMATFFVFSMFFLYIKNKKTIEIVSKIEIDMKKKIFNSIFKMSYKDFLINNDGKLLNLIEEDAMVFSNILSTLLSMIIDILSFFITIGIMLFLNSTLSIIFILIFPITSFIYYFTGKKLRKKQLELKNEHDDYISFITESLNNFKLLKIFNKETDRGNHFTSKIRNIYDIGITKILIETKSEILLQIVLFINNMVVLILGIYMIFMGTFTLGSLISFNSYSEKFKQSALSLTKINSSIQNMLVSLERIHNITTNGKYHFKVVEENYIKTENIHTVLINNLNYYVESKHILKNLNFEFRSGSINLVSGESGSGKTTLFNILTKLITSYSGQIFFDTVNIQNIPNKEYRKIICYVTQESLIFSETISNNLKLYNKNITQEEIIDICKKLNLHEFISKLENGYDTYIYKGGETISGGQAQRLCIARAALTNPDIFIFDEIISSLDAYNAKLITNFVEELSKEKIVVISFHQKLNVKSSYSILKL